MESKDIDKNEQIRIWWIDLDIISFRYYFHNINKIHNIIRLDSSARSLLSQQRAEQAKL